MSGRHGGEGEPWPPGPGAEGGEAAGALGSGGDHVVPALVEARWKPAALLRSAALPSGWERSVGLRAADKPTGGVSHPLAHKPVKYPRESLQSWREGVGRFSYLLAIARERQNNLNMCECKQKQKVVC